MPETRTMEDRVGDYWDALVLGHETDGVDLEPELADAIEQFDTLGGPTPTEARERVRRRLESLTNEGASVMSRVALTRPHGTPVGPATTANGHLNSPATPRQERVIRARRMGRWAMTHLATAALIVLTLVGGLAAFWQSPPARDDKPTRVPALIRALESVPGDVVEDQLIEVTFTPEQLPAGDVEAIFYQITLPPGVSLPYLAGPFCVLRDDLITSGVGAETVESGAYGLRLDAPISVQRDGASEVEEILAGTEVILGPGDAASYPDYTGQGTIRNAGDEPVVVTGVAIVSLEHSDLPAPKLPREVRAEQITTAQPADWRRLPTGPVTVSLWRLTLPQGTSVGPYEVMGMEALQIEAGTVTRGILPAGENALRTPPMVHMAGTSTSFMALPSGVRRVISSADDEPATLLALTIEPAGVWSGTLSP